MSSTMSDQARSAALGGAIYLVILQLGTRVVTFALNQVLLRLTTPEAFGTATIQLELLLNTILFLSREGIRGAVARTAPSLAPLNAEETALKFRLRGGDESVQTRLDQVRVEQTQLLRSRQAVLNVANLPVQVGAVLCPLVCLTYYLTSSATVRRQSYFAECVFMYGLASILELSIEYLYQQAQADLRIQVRVRIEGTAVIFKAIVTVLVLMWAGDIAALLAFGCGQLAYASVLVAGYRWQSQVVADRSKSRDEKTTMLAWALSKQSLVKQFLTEGDKLIVSRVSPIEDQGGYAVALNYGSLIARIVFQPVEESSRLYFSQALNGREQDDKSAKADTARAWQVLSSLITAHLHLALLLVTIAPPLVPPLLHHVLGARWSATSAPVVLQAYCYFIPALGLNGSTEAFMQAVASPDQLARVSRLMTVFSAIYIAACYVFVQTMGLKERGLIYANIVNMALRIMLCSRFIKRYFEKRKITTASKIWRPGTIVILAFAASGALTRYTVAKVDVYGLRGFLVAASAGALLASACLALSAYCERDRLKLLLTRQR